MQIEKSERCKRDIVASRENVLESVSLSFKTRLMTLLILTLPMMAQKNGMFPLKLRLKWHLFGEKGI